MGPIERGLSDRDEKAGLHGMRYAPNDRRAFKHKKRRPAMKKISTAQAYGKEILKSKANDRCRSGRSLAVLLSFGRLTHNDANGGGEM
jgi:hypothetical protein